MAKKFPPGPCVHCTEHFDVLTSDHVFPKAWYPESTPANLEKWQVPACEACNRDYGRIEQDLLLLIGSCLSNERLESLGIGTKVINAVNPAKGRDEKDKKIRLRKGEKLIHAMRVPDPKRPMITLTDNPSGQVVGIPRTELERVGEKIIRGMIYIDLGQIVTVRDEIVCDAIPGNGAQIDSIAKARGVKHARGPGIEVYWVRDEKEPIYGLFYILLFGGLAMRGGIMPRGYIPLSMRS